MKRHAGFPVPLRARRRRVTFAIMWSDAAAQAERSAAVVVGIDQTGSSAGSGSSESAPGT
jgi:hypothetical protein